MCDDSGSGDKRLIGGDAVLEGAGRRDSEIWWCKLTSGHLNPDSGVSPGIHALDAEWSRRSR